MTRKAGFTHRHLWVFALVASSILLSPYVLKISAKVSLSYACTGMGLKAFNIKIWPNGRDKSTHTRNNKIS